MVSLPLLFMFIKWVTITNIDWVLIICQAITLLRALHVSSLLIFKIAKWGAYSYPHCTEEENDKEQVSLLYDLNTDSITCILNYYTK